MNQWRNFKFRLPLQENHLGPLLPNKNGLSRTFYWRGLRAEAPKRDRDSRRQRGQDRKAARRGVYGKGTKRVSLLSLPQTKRRPGERCKLPQGGPGVLLHLELERTHLTPINFVGYFCHAYLRSHIHILLNIKLYVYLSKN